VADVVVSVVVKPGALRAEHPVVAFVPAGWALGVHRWLDSNNLIILDCYVPPWGE
jgi:hypothetical protein